VTKLKKFITGFKKLNKKSPQKYLVVIFLAIATFVAAISLQKLTFDIRNKAAGTFEDEIWYTSSRSQSQAGPCGDKVYEIKALIVFPEL
jgi:hypothetical protein